MNIDKHGSLLLLFLCSLVFQGLEADDAIPYDYTATIECLASPHKPQYNGGIVINPEFDNGLQGWSTHGTSKLEHRVLENGNNSFIVARARNQSYDSFSQKFYLHKDLLYTFSAWIQVSDGNVLVTATFKMSSGYQFAGVVAAEAGCWSMMKGGIRLNASGPAELYFESNNTSVEIWADSISFQPFTQDQWKSHQDQSIERARKGKVRLQVVDATGKPLRGARLGIKQNLSKFPFGCAMTKHILDNQLYSKWFAQRFRYTTFENEMKWYANEASQGKEDYSLADAMLQFAKSNNIAVRGHNVFWEDPKMQPQWVNSLSADQLKAATEKRITSVMTRYAGQLIAWDVVNENLHWNTFESKLGDDFTNQSYQRANQIDHKTTLFLNEFNTIEQSGDAASSPANYLKKLKEIQAYGQNAGIPFAIGLEAHFNEPNLPYVRSSIDFLATAKVPIWLTELDVEGTDDSSFQATNLEKIIMEAHSHPAIQGIVMWAAWKPEGCYRMCLTDNNFKNLPTGDVVDKFLNELSHAGLVGISNEDGIFEVSLYHGEYEVTVDRIDGRNLSSAQFSHWFNVVSAEDGMQDKALDVQIEVSI